MDRRGDRVYFDQALRDASMLFRETPWDAGRTLAALLHHVWTEKHDPHECITCAKAEAYVTVLGGSLQLPEGGA